MTTDEALEYCKRFDDPKLHAQMGTDFSRAMGTVGALLALRAELDTLRGKLRELDAWANLSANAQMDEFANFDSSYDEGRFDAFGATQSKLRELGLITEARDGE